MIYNKKMEKILNRILNDGIKVSLSLINDKKITEPIFKLLHGCLLIDNEERLSENKVNLQRVLTVYGDKTGYEASCNEVRINDYIYDENLNECEIVQLGLLVIENWKKTLSRSINVQGCVFILSLNEGYVTIRVYINRVDEKDWLDNELDEYDEAIAIL